MAQPLLHRRQDIPARFDEQDTVQGQADIGQAWSEQVGLAQHPQDGAIEPREDRGGEQGRGGGVLGVRAAAHGFMQGAQRQAAIGQDRVNRRQADRHNAPFGFCPPAFKLGDPCAEGQDLTGSGL